MCSSHSAKTDANGARRVQLTIIGAGGTCGFGLAPHFRCEFSEALSESGFLSILARRTVSGAALILGKLYATEILRDQRLSKRPVIRYSQSGGYHVSRWQERGR